MGNWQRRTCFDSGGHVGRLTGWRVMFAGASRPGRVRCGRTDNTRGPLGGLRSRACLATRTENDALRDAFFCYLSLQGADITAIVSWKWCFPAVGGERGSRSVGSVVESLIYSCDKENYYAVQG